MLNILNRKTDTYKLLNFIYILFFILLLNKLIVTGYKYT